jgi:hypothetical protein
LQPYEGAPAARAPIRRFHDARPCARDDAEAFLAQQTRGLDRRVILRIVLLRPRRSEDAHALLDRRETVETFDELSGDAHNAPRIGGAKVGARPAGLQQLRVLCQCPGRVPDVVVVRDTLEELLCRVDRSRRMRLR